MFHQPGLHRIFRDALNFAKAKFLDPVFANNAGTVYQVKGFEPSSTMPNPVDQPGFCKS